MRSGVLEQLKTFSADGMELDGLVELAAAGRSLRAEYEVLQLEVPDELDTGLKAVRREINDRVADRKAARLKELKARRATLKTAEEKRDELDKQIAELESAGVTA